MTAIWVEREEATRTREPLQGFMSLCLCEPGVSRVGSAATSNRVEALLLPIWPCSAGSLSSLRWLVYAGRTSAPDSRATHRLLTKMCHPVRETFLFCRRDNAATPWRSMARSHALLFDVMQLQIPFCSHRSLLYAPKVRMRFRETQKQHYQATHIAAQAPQFFVRPSPFVLCLCVGRNSISEKQKEEERFVCSSC